MILIYFSQPFGTLMLTDLVSVCFICCVIGSWQKFMSLLDLGLIRPSELFSYFEVEGTKFEKGVFSLFDEGTEG